MQNLAHNQVQNPVQITPQFVPYLEKGRKKMPKIAPTHEIVPFCPKNEEKYTERWSRRKKKMQKETLNPVFVVVKKVGNHLIILVLYAILCHFHMEYCKLIPSPFLSGVKLSTTCTSPEVEATLYHQLVGNVLYLTHSRIDLSFVVGRVSYYMQTPHETHWKAGKRILRYI